MKLEIGKHTNCFNRILESKSNFSVLPLMHSVDCFDAKEILINKEILPLECDVFENEKLVYLFYGVPNYRVSQGIESCGDVPYYPVCFLLENIDY